MNNHTRKVLEMIEAGKLQRGEARHLDIFHDDWCNLLNHRGECNCNPVIEKRPAPQGKTTRLNKD